MNKKNNSELTILIIHYQDKRILETLRVLNNCKFRSNFHVHIQDGGSRQEDLDAIKKLMLYQDTIESKKDKGIFDGINNSLKHIKCDYFTWIGCDDFINDDYNWPAVRDLLLSGQKGVQSDVIYFDDFSITRYVKAKSNSLVKYLLGLPLYHFGSTWNRSVLGDLNFDIRYRVAADFDFFHKVLRKGVTIKKCNESVVLLGDGGNSSASIAARKEGYTDIFKSYPLKLLFPLFFLVRVFFKLKTKFISKTPWVLKQV